MSNDLPIPAKKLMSRSFKQRMLGEDHRHNYYLRARNAVVGGRLGEGVVSSIADEYDGHLYEDFEEEWRKLLSDVLYHLLEDEILDPEELQFVRSFVSELGMPRDHAEAAYQVAAKRVVGNRLEQEVGPEGPSEAQMTAFAALARRLKLTNKEAAFKDLVGPVLEKHIDFILEDGLVSPDEWDRHVELCRRCGVPVRLSPVNQGLVDMAREQWESENLPLNPADPGPMRLKPGEIAYFEGQAEWYELRKVRIESGVSVDRYKLIARGSIYLTSKRAILVSDAGGNKSLSWSSVLYVDRVGDREIECEKATGKSPVIQFHPMSAAGCVIAQRLQSGEMD